MLLTLTLPRITDWMTSAVIDAVHVEVGTALSPGAKLFDLTVDLSAIAPQDCPPVSHYRLVLRERAFLRKIRVAPGDEIEVGALLGEFTTSPDDPPDLAPARGARITIAGVLGSPERWRRDAS